MYIYLYDNFLRHKKYDATVKAMEKRLTDFGIAGKIIRLQTFTSSDAIIAEEIRRGAKNVIIVGNDTTFGHVLSRSASQDVAFGFLPVGSNNSIAEVLGIPVGVEACEVLSKRRRLMLDVGWFNNRFFINQLYIKPAKVSVTYDDRFTVSAKNAMIELVVCNLQPFVWRDGGKKQVSVHPQDEKLEAFLRPVVGKKLLGGYTYEEPSIFPFEEMIVKSKKAFEVVADGKRSKEVNIKIKLAKNRINMIVGKFRQF
jgi:hypothetical protein